MASSPSTSSAATRTSPPTPSSINPRSQSFPISLPTQAPVQGRSGTHQQLFKAYAIPVRDRQDRQAIDTNNASVDYTFQAPLVIGKKDHKGKGKAIEVDSAARLTYSEGSKRRNGSLRRRTTRSALDLGFVDGPEGARRNLEKRLPTAEGYPSCNYVGNGILSCYPESNTTIVQGDYSKFIWNAQFPTFIGAGDVDIYLYNANTEEIATSWQGVQNARGMIGITPDEEWWPEESANEWFNSDRNQTIPYYFVVVDGGSQLTGGETHQSTFTVIQTAPPVSLSSTLAVLTASSLSSVSSVSAASASSVASQLSQSSLSAASSGTGSGGSSSASGSSRPTTANGELQPSGGGGGPAIPKWAIAIIVILGFFALVAGAFAIVFCLGRAKKRRRQEATALSRGGGGGGGGEGSPEEREALGGSAAMGGLEEGGATTRTDDGLSSGSREPILGTSPGSPARLAPAMLGAGAGGAAVGAIAGGAGRDKDESDDEKNAGGLDRNDAARMAEAFRAALRRPEFPHNGGTESSGESGGGLFAGPRGETENVSSNDVEEEDTTPEGGRELIEEELRSEGKSIRDVAGGGGKRWG